MAPIESNAGAGRGARTYLPVLLPSQKRKVNPTSTFTSSNAARIEGTTRGILIKRRVPRKSTGQRLKAESRWKTPSKFNTQTSTLSYEGRGAKTPTRNAAAFWGVCADTRFTQQPSALQVKESCTSLKHTGESLRIFTLGEPINLHASTWLALCTAVSCQSFGVFTQTKAAINKTYSNRARVC